MRKIILLIVLIFSVKSFSQDTKTTYSGWSIKAGLNFVDSSGERTPLSGLSNFNENAFGGVPLHIAIEKRFSKTFGLEGSGSINSWDAGSGVIDGSVLLEDENYLALDFNGKLYFDGLFNFSPKMSWLDLYAIGGFGFFNINGTSLNVNYGLGASIWFSDSVGLDFNGIAKGVVGDVESLQSGHFLYTAGIVFKLKKKSKVEEKPEEKEVSVLVDSDSDSVPDNIDNCPNIAGVPENKGCPYVDSDNDGVIDKADRCALVAGSPENNGCPYEDSDNDGVIDKADNCPKVPGSKENKGCPITPVKEQEVIKEPKYEKKDSSKTYVKTESLVELTKKIKFQSGNYNFTQETYPFLIQIAKILNQELSSSRFKIIGHTDSSGSYDANRVLSVKRASAVRNYLVDSGISKDRIRIEGKGESDPIDSNLTKEGRENNRRVDILIIK